MGLDNVLLYSLSLFSAKLKVTVPYLNNYLYKNECNGEPLTKVLKKKENTSNMCPTLFCLQNLGS